MSKSGWLARPTLPCEAPECGMPLGQEQDDPYINPSSLTLRTPGPESKYDDFEEEMSDDKWRAGRTASRQSKELNALCSSLTRRQTTC